MGVLDNKLSKIAAIALLFFSSVTCFAALERYVATIHSAGIASGNFGEDSNGWNFVAGCRPVKDANSIRLEHYAYAGGLNSNDFENIETIPFPNAQNRVTFLTNGSYVEAISCTTNQAHFTSSFGWTTATSTCGYTSAGLVTGNTYCQVNFEIADLDCEGADANTEFCQPPPPSSSSGEQSSSSSEEDSSSSSSEDSSSSSSEDSSSSSDDEDNNECPDGTGNGMFSLQKKSIFEDSYDNKKEDVSYEIWGNKTRFYYDALGRKTQAEPSTRRYLFDTKKNVNLEKEHKGEFGILSRTYTTSCYKNLKGKLICTNDSDLIILRRAANDSCGKIGVDYGIMESDSIMTGGITCAGTKVNGVPQQPTVYERVETCSDGSAKIRVDVNVKYTTQLDYNEPFSVPTGYQFPNGYTATVQDSIAMYYHEEGHVKYYSCTEFPVLTKRISGTYCESEIPKMISQESKCIATEHDKLLENSAALFHNNYGNFGHDTTYQCPNN